MNDEWGMIGMRNEEWRIINIEWYRMYDEWWMMTDEWIKEDEDEEWGEYREKLKDYSVLKIESVRLVDSIDTEVES